MILRCFLIGNISLLVSGAVLAQVGVVSENEDIDNVESLDGLESATPTDDVNELNSNGSPNTIQQQSSNENNFDLGNDADGSQNVGGNGFFDDNDADLGGSDSGSGALAAFGQGNNQGQKATNENATPQDPPLTTENPVVNSNVPVNLGGGTTGNELLGAPNAAIMNSPNNSTLTAPGAGNAQALMDQISTDGATGILPAPEQSATATESIPPPPPSVPELPPAPPLPPPNEFSGAPPVPGTMRLMADGEAPEEYLVQAGDTLFDICDQLLDEPGYWPKLWALNPEIKNPHFIFPNMRLRFYPGDDDTPPYLQVVTEEDVIPIDKGDLDEQLLIAEKVIFEADSQAVEDTLIEVIGPEGVDGQVEDFLTGGKLYNGTEIQVQVPGFIFREEKVPLAYVIRGSHGEISAGPGKKVLIESLGEIEDGTLYTVLRKGEKISDPRSGEFIGFKYYFIANARVQKKLDDGVAIAKIENVRLSVRPDDIVVNFISTSRMIPAVNTVGNLSSVSANVVGFQFFDQEIGGMGNYAFLDKGNGEGVTPGMYVPVYSTPGYLTKSFGFADLPEDYELIGVLRIIDTTEAGAVGYIVQNSKELRIGDRTRKS